VSLFFAAIYFAKVCPKLLDRSPSLFAVLSMCG
jgi:hypothetical protein